MFYVKSDNKLSGHLISLLPGLEVLWAITLGDVNVRIAVLDGPCDLEHSCFYGAMLATPETLFSNVADSGFASQHGTHVASIIFGQHTGPVRGIAPLCTGILVPVFEDAPDGSFKACSQLDLARAITQAVEAGAHVITISGGRLAYLAKDSA
jgi:subtilisin family serine protease